MNISLPFNKSAEISFTMDVAGTSARPTSVQISLEKGSTVLAFKAQEYQAGQWKAIVTEANSVFGVGDLTYTINVLINGRLITPFRGVATIQNDESIKIDIPESVEQAQVNGPAPISIPEEIKPVVEVVKESPAAPVVKKVPEVKKAQVVEVAAKPEVKIEEQVKVKPTTLPLLKTIEAPVKAKPVVVTENKKTSVKKAQEQPFSVTKIRVFYK